MAEPEKNPVKNPSFGWILSEIFSCAWNVLALASITIPSGYMLLREMAGERLGPKFDAFERRLAKVTGFFRRHTPIIRNIPKEEFERGKPGSALLNFGTIQIPIIAFTAALSLSSPSLAGWLTTAATALFAASNIKFGLQLNHIDADPAAKPNGIVRLQRRLLKIPFRRRCPENEPKLSPPKALLTRRGVIKEIGTSPIVLDAMGTSFIAAVAGVWTTFGTLAAIPIGISMASAGLVAYDELSKAKLNTALPMLALAGASAATAVSAAATGDLMLAAANVCCAWGDVAFAVISHKEFVADRPKRVPIGLMDRISYPLIYWRGQESKPLIEPTRQPDASAFSPSPIPIPVKATAAAASTTSSAQMAIVKVEPRALLVIEPRQKVQPRRKPNAAQVRCAALRNEPPSASAVRPSKASSNPMITTTPSATTPDVAFASFPTAWQRNAPPPPSVR